MDFTFKVGKIKYGLGKLNKDFSLKLGNYQIGIKKKRRNFWNSKS